MKLSGDFKNYFQTFTQSHFKFILYQSIALEVNYNLSFISIVIRCSIQPPTHKNGREVVLTLTDFTAFAGVWRASNCSDRIAIKRWPTESFKSYRMMSRFTKIAQRITCKSSSKRRPHRQHLTHLANFFDSSETLLAINLVPASADPCGVGVKKPAHPHLYLPRSGRRSQSRKFPFRH